MKAPGFQFWASTHALGLLGVDEIRISTVSTVKLRKRLLVISVPVRALAFDEAFGKSSSKI